MSSLSCDPKFPSLDPRLVDPQWFQVDAPKDEDGELSRLEREHEAKMKAIAKSYSDITPIGKTSQEPAEEEEDDEDEDDNDDNDESESHEEEEDIDMDMNFGVQESPGNGT